MALSQGKNALAFSRQWHHVSSTSRILGTLSSRIAWVLMGKHKPTYDPSVDAGDYVLVTSPKEVGLTGKKGTDKVYRSYSGFMGGLKEVPIGTMRERRPEEIIRKAVSTMLPKNTHRDRRLLRLKIFNGSLADLEAAEAEAQAAGLGAGGRLAKERSWLRNCRSVWREEGAVGGQAQVGREEVRS